MSKDKYENFMVNIIILFAPFAIGIWLFLGLMKLIY
jgi:hypothetical protein